MKQSGITAAVKDTLELLDKLDHGRGAAEDRLLDALADLRGRIRQCRCGSYFFATTSKKAVCSDACRFQKFKEASPTFNQERAAYMRKYRKGDR